MSIEQDAILALARQQQLAGSLGAKGNVTSADIKNLLSPELGYLTGTFYGQQGTGEEDDELFWMDYAPNFRKALTLPDTDIRKIIAGEIYRGAAPWDVKRQIEEYTASQADLSPGLINQEGETKDLQSFANTVFTEYNNYQVAKTKAARKSAGEDPFVAGGVPYPDMDFAPQYLAPDLFENLAKEAAARNAESNKKSYVEETLSATEVCEKFNLNRIYLSRSKIPYNPVSGGKKLYLKSEVEFHLIKKEANDYQIQKYGRAYYPN